MKTDTTYPFGHRYVDDDHRFEHRWTDESFYHAKLFTRKRKRSPKRSIVPDLLLRDALNTALTRCPTIAVDPEVMGGQPCIAGTRIPVRSVLRVVEHYGSLEEVVKCYPHLTHDQGKDAIYFTQVLLELSSGIDQTSVAS